MKKNGNASNRTVAGIVLLFMLGFFCPSAPLAFLYGIGWTVWACFALEEDL